MLLYKSNKVKLKASSCRFFSQYYISIGKKIYMMEHDYGYFCDPSNLEYEYIQRVRINNNNKMHSYLTVNELYESTPNTIVVIEDEFDYEYIHPKSNKYLWERINKYTDLFVAGCVIVITITFTSTLVKYNII